MIKLILLLSLLSAPLHATTLTLDPARTVHITGPVTGSVVVLANTVYKMALASPAPVYVVINSPGGAVYSGIQFITAMKLARFRGVKFKCLVTLMAASMAFDILANCDERYAFRSSLMLWHPMKISFPGPASADDMEYEASIIRAEETPILENYIKLLKIPREVFYEHYRRETLWTGQSLSDISPHFLTLVDNVEGMKELFTPMRVGL